MNPIEQLAERLRKLEAVAHQAENLFAHLSNNYIPQNMHHSAELLREALRELKDE